jgi:hypothetical protein
MPADLILNSDTIELLDARLVEVKPTDEDGSTLVQITGRLRASESVSATELRAEKIRVGAGARGEPRPSGEVVVNDSVGTDFFRVRDAGSAVRCEIGTDEKSGVVSILGERARLISGGRVTAHQVEASRVEVAEVLVGQGAPGEPRDAGVIRMRNDGGNQTVEIDAGGTDIEKPSIKVRWRTFQRPDVPEVRVGNPRLGGGSGFPFRGRGRVMDNEGNEPDGSTVGEFELDLVEEILSLRRAVKDLTGRVQELEGDG